MSIHTKLDVDPADCTCELKGMFHHKENYCPLSGGINITIILPFLKSMLILTYKYCSFVSNMCLSYYAIFKGDPRVNEQPLLSSFHTIFMRGHNSIAAGLSKVNAHWGDEILYQIARKIMIGVWQNIVYGEYLPQTIGRSAMSSSNIQLAVRD